MLTGNKELEEVTVASTEHVTVRYVIIALTSNSLLTTHYVLTLLSAMVHSCIIYLRVNTAGNCELHRVFGQIQCKKKNSPENYFVSKVAGYNSDQII